VGEGTDPAVVRLEGEHDVSTRNVLRLNFQRARQNRRLIVDMTRLRYADSTVITELLRAESRARDLGGKLVLVVRNQRMLQILSIAGLTTRTPIVDTMDSALRLMRDA
jgi:anti-anti-sigma factor